MKLSPRSVETESCFFVEADVKADRTTRLVKLVRAPFRISLGDQPNEGLTH